MSLADFRSACAEIDTSEEADFVGPCPEEQVVAAEQAIGFRFPPTYREFLLRYGCGDIYGEEFYGITGHQFESAGIPDAIGYTLRERREWQFPHNLLVIYQLGEGSSSCLDLSKRDNDGECPVVIWHPGSEETDKLEVEADDFGQFLRAKLEEAR